jgi:alanyl-tRNA synthetase
LDKLDQTADRLVKELKDANAERRKLVKELAQRESVGLEGKTYEGVDIGGIKLVRRDFEDEIDVDRMVRTANEIIKKDETTVTIFFGADGKSARIMVMAGKTAVGKGVNAGEIMREASPLIGGGGGGRPNFAQGGGTKIEKLSKAVQKAEEMLRKQLRWVSP